MPGQRNRGFVAGGYDRGSPGLLTIDRPRHVNILDDAIGGWGLRQCCSALAGRMSPISICRRDRPLKDSQIGIGWEMNLHIGEKMFNKQVSYYSHPGLSSSDVCQNPFRFQPTGGRLITQPGRACNSVY